MFKSLIYANEEYKNFLIDEHGNVKNLKTDHTYKNTIGKKGYLMVTLPLGARGKVKSIRIRKAVAETFIPNPNNYPVVHHKDEDKTNPYVENLEWTTHKENTRYHLEKLSKGTDFFNNRKLAESDVFVIRSLDGILSRKELSNMFNVSKTTITNVCNNNLYKTLP